MENSFFAAKKRRFILLWLCALLFFMPLTSYGGTLTLTGVKDSQTLWLINRNFPVDKSYYASDLKPVLGGTYLLRERAADAYQSMHAAMQKSGIKSVALASTYRSYDRQTYLFNTRTAEKQKAGMSYEKAYAATARFTAVPGTSEHQTGLAVDLSNNGSLTSAFGNTSQGKWLAANSWKYGFILRYQGAKETYTMIGNEPWHFRYVGMPHSKIMYENNWCYEEYIQHLKTQKKLEISQNSTSLYEVYYFPIKDGIPTKIENSLISPDSASIYCSGDNAGGFIVTVYGRYDTMEDNGESLQDYYAQQPETVLPM